MQINSLNHRSNETRRDLILRVFASPQFSRALLWFAPILFLLIFFFLPLSKILTLAFNTSALTKPSFQLILSVASFTFYQAALSTILTFALGLPSAILFSRFNFRGKSLLRALTAVPFMLPTVVVASSFSALFGAHGLLAVHPSPFALIILAHVFYNTTIVIRIVGNALSHLDPKLDHAARSLGANSLRVWRHITLPLLRPSMLAAALLVFLFDFTSFGVILLLGGSNFSTLEVEIYLRVLKLPNLSLAALLAIIQLIFTLIFSVLYTRTISRVVTQTAPRFAIARAPKSFRERVFVFTFYYITPYFFRSPLSRPPHPLHDPPRSGPWSTRRSPIWTHHRLLPENYSSIGADRCFMSRHFKLYEIHSHMPA